MLQITDKIFDIITLYFDQLIHLSSRQLTGSSYFTISLFQKIFSQKKVWSNFSYFTFSKQTVLPTQRQIQSAQ